MAQLLNEKKRICRIANNGVLTELHCVTGPIRRARLTKNEIVKLVRNGRTVFELDPEGKLPEVRLTTANCTVPQFEKKTEVKPDAPKQQAQVPNNNQNQNQNYNNHKKDKYDKYNKNNQKPAHEVAVEAPAENAAPATDAEITSQDF